MCLYHRPKRKCPDFKLGLNDLVKKNEMKRFSSQFCIWTGPCVFLHYYNFFIHFLFKDQTLIAGQNWSVEGHMHRLLRILALHYWGYCSGYQQSTRSTVLQKYSWRGQQHKTMQAFSVGRLRARVLRVSPWAAWLRHSRAGSLYTIQLTVSGFIPSSVHGFQVVENLWWWTLKVNLSSGSKSSSCARSRG